MDPNLERANILLRQGRVDEAITQVKNALHQNPDNDEALALYARCFYDKKQFDEGIKITLQAIVIDAGNNYYFYLLAFGFYRKNDNKTAVIHLERAIQLNPYFCESYGLLSHIYSEEKDFEKALEKANEGLAIDPENISCLNGRSVALNKLKRTEDAIETMQLALAQGPDNEFTHSTVGWNYLEKGKNKIAATHFKETLRINPNNTNARRGLKEALKSKIAPYRWLLQYSFWINNKGKKARWIFPLALYILVRISSTALEYNTTTQSLGTLLIGLYILFVLITWLINPLANFFLLFHKDGKHAVNDTERWTAITVVIALIIGSVLFYIGYSTVEDKINMPVTIAAIAFWAMAIPLGNIRYPLSFTAYDGRNKIALVLTGLAILTAILSFIYLPAAIVTGGIFLVLFIINNWVSIFK